MKRFLSGTTVIVLSTAIAVVALFPLSTPTQTPNPSPPAPPAVVTLTIPDQVTGTVGDFIQVTATTNAENITWRVDKTATSLKLMPCSKIKDPKTAWLTSGVTGTFNLYCCAGGAAGVSTIQVCSVTVNPLPLPPAPPSPVVAALQAAYASDTDPRKGIYAADFGEVFLNVLNDTTLNTSGAILARIKDARQSLVGNGLAAERQVIDTDLQSLFPTSPTAVLDAPTLAKLKAEFTVIGNALKSLGLVGK